MRKVLFFFVFGLFFFVLQTKLQAQLPPPPPDPTTEETPPCWPPPCIPIDGGITILAMAGAGYAAKKLYMKNINNRKLP